MGQKNNPLRGVQRELEFALRDIMLFRLFDVPTIFKTQLLYVQDATPRHRYNYQNDQQVRMWDIFYKKQRICRLVRSSPKKILIDKLYGDDKFVQKLIERIATEYMPQAKVEVVYEF